MYHRLLMTMSEIYIVLSREPVLDGLCMEEENRFQSPNFYTFKEPKHQFHGINSAILCSLAGRYGTPIPTRFLAPTDCSKIPALD